MSYPFYVNLPESDLGDRYSCWQLYERPYVRDELYTAALVFGDSRICNFIKFEWMGLNVNTLIVTAIRGAEIDEMFPIIFQKLRPYRNKFVSVKLCLGTNNILHGESPLVVFNKLRDCKRKILNDYEFGLVAFGDIAHVDFENEGSTHIQVLTTSQANARIDAVNTLIHNENKVTYEPFHRGGASCYLAMHVSKLRQRKNLKGHPYKKERMQRSRLRDGVHATNATKTYWIRSIIASINIDVSTFARYYDSI